MGKLSATSIWLYAEIDSMIDKQKPLVMEYADSNWGLCCNSIHMIDIFMMLSGEKPISLIFLELYLRLRIAGVMDI